MADPRDRNRDPAAGQAPDPAVGRITLISRPGCHLCDDARAVIRAVADDLGVGWQEWSIDDDPDLRRRYAEQIPVTLVDGAPHDFWRVSPARLRAALGAGR